MEYLAALEDNSRTQNFDGLAHFERGEGESSTMINGWW